MRITRHPLALLAASGVLAAAPLVFPPLFVLSFFGAGGAYLALRNIIDKKHLYAKGLLFFACFNLPVYSFFLWMHPLDFAGFSRPASLALLIFAVIGISAIHSAVQAVIFPLSALISKKKPSPSLAPVFASLWVLSEWLLEQGALGFPWNRIAMGQYLFKPFIGSASLFGSLFVSFLVILIPSLTAEAITQKSVRVGAVPCLILAADLIFGAVYSVPVTGSLTVAAVQANVGSGDKWEDGSFEKIVNDHVALSREASGSDVIFWPESAVPVDLGINPSWESLYTSLSEELDAPILAGTLVTKDGESKNCVAYFDENGIFNLYAKRHLVPFGEYLPAEELLRSVLPFLSQLNLFSSPFTPGPDAAVAEVRGVKIGSLVCFDSAFSSLAADSAKNGAQLLFLATNDSWYKDSPACTQHLAQSVFRAVENRRSVVIAANTGISAIIDPDGGIAASLAPLTAGTLTGEAKLCDANTLYTYAGDVPVLTGALVILAVCGILSRKGKSAKGGEE